MSKLFLAVFTAFILLFASMTGCTTSSSAASKTPTTTSQPTATAGSRASTPVVLSTEQSGDKTFDGKSSIVDVSNSSDGYIMVKYTGSKSKIKMQLTKSGGTTYTYDLDPQGKFEVFPISAGSGSYTLTINENISGTSYAQVDTAKFDVSLSDEFGPFLHPSTYVNFTAETTAVKQSEQVVKSANTDLEAVELIYEYVINNISYDYDFAERVSTFYVPDLDGVMSSKSGLCFDYAAVMTAMLRAQQIPTQLVLGYSGQTYHAWISVYTPETGWIHDIIQFDGKNWVRMDPTFASTSSNNPDIIKYVGDGKNYNAMYVY